MTLLPPGSGQLPRRRNPWLMRIIIMLLIVLICTVLIQILRLYLFNASQITVTLVPYTQLKGGNYQLTAVTSTPDPNKRQIPARPLSATSSPQNTTANATGTIQAVQATGTLAFFNQTSGPIIIQGATLISKSGVAFRFQGPITVPPIPDANSPAMHVPARAVNSGAAGNISAHSIDGDCCTPGISVQNFADFTGGQDAQANSMIQQSDIDNAVSALRPALTQNAQANLQKQIQKNEAVVDRSMQCQPNVNADHQAGDVAKTVTVTVTITCHEEVYDYQAAQTMTAGLLQAQVTNDPDLGKNYMLEGQMVFNVLESTATNAGQQVDLSVQAQGQWVYSFSQVNLRDLANQIAGKSEAEARVFLLRQMGVKNVQFSAPGNLPTDADEIQIVKGSP